MGLRSRPLAAALALLASAGAAQAQPALKLAGTADNASLAGLGGVSFSLDYAQAFTTGSNAGGYKLTRLDIRMQVSGAAPSYTVKIHADSSTCTPTTLTSCPGSEVGTLTNPGSPPSTAGVAEYDAPTGGIDLDPNTTYWLTRVVTGNTSVTWTWYEHFLDDEDDDPAAGWSIANDSLFRPSGTPLGSLTLLP